MWWLIDDAGQRKSRPYEAPEIPASAGRPRAAKRARMSASPPSAAPGSPSSMRLELCGGEKSVDEIHAADKTEDAKLFLGKLEPWNLIVDEKHRVEGGVDIIDIKSRIRYGCKLLGCSEEQGCKP